MPNTIVTVNFNQDPPTVAPDPAPVKKGDQNGLEWQATTAGYTFLGVAIDVGPDRTDDFGDPVIGTWGGGKSNMTISDALTLPKDTEINYKYTLRYEYMDGSEKKIGFIDPTIRNRG